MNVAEQEVFRRYKNSPGKLKHTSAGTGTENMVLVVMASGLVPSLNQNRRQLNRVRIACGLPGEGSGVLGSDRYPHLT